MAVSAQSPAPYTTASAVLSIIRRFRERGLATPITAEVLSRSSVVSDTLIPRTLAALVSLELIDDRGEPTQTFQKIRTVPEADYKTCLAEWLRSVYADVFSFVDPSKDDPIRVRDAFRSYVPTGQQERMVILFLALCAEAGIVAESNPSDANSKPAARVSSITSRTVYTRQKAKPNQNQNTGNSGTHVGNSSLALPPALTGILQSIPSPEKGWTKETRDRFVTAFGVVLDFAIPIKSAESGSSEGESS